MEMKADIKLDRREVETWIEAKTPELLNDFITILQIRSVAEPEIKEPPFGTGCKEVLEQMLKIGDAYGFSTFNYDNYVGRITYKGTGKKEDIGIWCHLDVVDDKDGRGYDWEYPPYNPTLKNGGIIARGAQDNKSSAIMALYVLRYLKEHNIEVDNDISLYCGTCEEQGMFDLDYFTENYSCPALSLVPDAGFPICQGERGSFNGELTSVKDLSDKIIDIHSHSGLYMVPDNAFIYIKKSQDIMEKLNGLPERVSIQEEEDRVKIFYRGESIHAANPTKGINAFHGLVSFLLERRILEDDDEKIFRFAKEINDDCRGSALDLFCEDELSGPIVLVGTQAEMNGSKLVINFISKYPVTKNEMDFSGIAAAAGEKKGFTLKVTRCSKAIIYPSDHPVIELLTNIYSKISGEEAKPFIMSGGTYARKLPNAFAYGTGLPEKWPPDGMFLPGHGDYHQPDESISVKRIKKALLIYIFSIFELDKLKELK